MPRPLRLRIAGGLYAFVLGVLFAYGAPLAVVLFHAMPQARTSFAEMSENPGAMMQEINSLQQTAYLVQMLAIGGWTVAIAGALVAFFTWVNWFAGSDPKTESTGTL